MKQQNKVLNKYCEEVQELLSIFPPTLLEFQLLWESGERQKAWQLTKNLIAIKDLATSESFDHASNAVEAELA